ncbi:MAG: AAA family ATPase [Pseudomonadota bacterium]
MQRYLINELKQWVISPRRKPLLLRGARQVGKSTAVRMAMKDSGRQLLEINLEKFLRLDSVFSTLDLKKILPALEVETRIQIRPETSVLFLDEIQATPHAIAALRYFYEELPELPVIAAGSLLEFALGDKPISMPVGRISYHHVGPLTFDEFLTAKGEDFFLEKLATYSFGDQWPTAAHERGVRLVREFMMVGGMPAALSRHLADDADSRSFVPELQSIIDTYKDDFAKYTRRGALLPVLQQLYDFSPRYIGKRLILKEVAPDARHEYIRAAVTLLEKARVLLLARQNDGAGIPLVAGAKDKAPKIFWLDVGLANRMLNFDPAWMALNLDMTHAGQVAEQFVAQHLHWWFGAGSAPALHYWARAGKTVNAEVDFIVQLGTHIFPVEVKSGVAGSLRSLHQFLVKGHAPFGVRLDMDLPGIHPIDHEVRVGSAKHQRLKSKLISLPLYMIGQMRRLMESQV